MADEHMRPRHLVEPLAREASEIGDPVVKARDMTDPGIFQKATRSGLATPVEPRNVPARVMPLCDAFDMLFEKIASPGLEDHAAALSRCRRLQPGPGAMVPTVGRGPALDGQPFGMGAAVEGGKNHKTGYGLESSKR